MDQSLKFTVFLSDKTQAAFGSINKSMKGMMKTQESFAKIGGGAAGIMAIGTAIGGIISPARDMNMALGELNSLLGDAGSTTLPVIQNASMDFADEYGASAAEFVRASYDIQSSISGLSGFTLSEFTRSSAVLAMATKSDTATITDYMGTMYSIFQDSANKMGKAKWINILAGQTAQAVEMFKTTGNKMSEAFSSLGSTAMVFDISQAEQIASLGMIQSTMGGAASGTAYASFLNAIPRSQEVLGTSFTDESGKLFKLVDIMGKLEMKFGATLDVSEIGLLTQSFGEAGSAFVKNMWGKTADLEANIAKLENISGMDKALQMAKSMSDPFNGLSESIKNVNTVFGQSIVETILPAIYYMTEAATTMRRWIFLFPNLTKFVGVLTIGVTALASAMAIYMAVSGAAKLAAIAWALTFAPLILGVKTLTFWLARQAIFMFLAFGWIPFLIAAAVVAIGLIITYWDELKAAFLDTSWGQAISKAFDAMIGKIKYFISLLADAWDSLTGLFSFDSAELDPTLNVNPTFNNESPIQSRAPLHNFAGYNNTGLGLDPALNINPAFNNESAIQSRFPLHDFSKDINNGLDIEQDNVEYANRLTMLSSAAPQQLYAAPNLSNAVSNASTSTADNSQKVEIKEVNFNTESAPTPMEFESYLSMVSP